MARPSTSGAITLATPTDVAARICARTPSGQRSSRPMMNMNSTRPKVDSADSPASELAEKIAACAFGASAPSTMGPRTTPAAISPTTPGCPRRLASQLQARATTRTTISCRRRSVVGDMIESELRRREARGTGWRFCHRMTRCDRDVSRGFRHARLARPTRSSSHRGKAHATRRKAGDVLHSGATRQPGPSAAGARALNGNSRARRIRLRRAVRGRSLGGSARGAANHCVRNCSTVLASLPA